MDYSANNNSQSAKYWRTLVAKEFTDQNNLDYYRDHMMAMTTVKSGGNGGFILLSYHRSPESMGIKTLFTKRSSSF